MRIRRGLLTWGVFLVLAGSIPLAVRAGYLTADQLGVMGSLWPLVLIGVGIGILLERTRVAFAGGLLVAATLGVIAGGLLGGGIEGFAGGACGPGRGATAFADREDTLGPTATVEIDLNCGDLSVAVQAGNGWRIVGEDGDGIGPEVDADTDSLSVRARDDKGAPFGVLGDRESWRITIPDAVRLDLALDLNAGSATIDLAGASVGALELNLNAGSAVVDLGSTRDIEELQVEINAGSLNLTLPSDSLTGSIEANAGSVNLCVPPGAAVKLNTSDSLAAGYAYENRGLVKTGSTWQTPGFENAAVRIELDTQANAGSFSLDPEDGCRG